MKRLLLIICTVVFAQEADHLLLTRIVTQPDKAESFSIYNPTNDPINLSNYYVCDDEEYYKMQTDGDMSPSSSIGGFTVQFPDVSIASGDTFHIVLSEDYNDFYGEDFVADLVMYGTSDSSLTGFMGFASNKIEELEELIVLFKWDGESNHIIEDVDYFVWSSLDGITKAVDKTGVGSYPDDTAVDNQLFFKKVPGQYYAYSRKSTDEIDEIQTNGNGITGHDETSENFRESWEISLLFNLGCTDDKKPNFDPMAEKDDETCIDFTIEQIYNQWGSELSSAPCNENWDPGQTIYTMGLIIDYQVTSGPKIITIEDENGYRLDGIIWDWDPMFSDKTKEFVDYYDPTEYIVLITGSLGIYNCNFQLDINSEDDITYFNSFHPFGDFNQDSSVIAAKIEPAPFVLIPTLGEHLDFSYSFPKNSRVIIRVFDISGRFITSIVDRYFDQAGKVDRMEDHSEWDGRDHLGQIVTPGTYIMHIEAMNPITGETHTDAAPVVVGVKN